jgi:hypothetical protein
VTAVAVMTCSQTGYLKEKDDDPAGPLRIAVSENPMASFLAPSVATSVSNAPASRLTHYDRSETICELLSHIGLETSLSSVTRNRSSDMFQNMSTASTFHVV